MRVGRRLPVFLAVCVALLLGLVGNAWAGYKAYTGTGRADFLWCSDAGCVYRADSWYSNVSVTWSQTGTNAWTVTKSESFGCASRETPWEGVVVPTQVNYYNNSSKSTKLFTAYQSSYSPPAICPSDKPRPFNGQSSSQHYFTVRPYIAPLTTYQSDGSIIPDNQGSEWSTAKGPLF